MKEESERVCKSCLLRKPIEEFQRYYCGKYRRWRHVCIVCFRKRWDPVTAAHGKRYYHENVNGYRDKLQARSRALYATPEGHQTIVTRAMQWNKDHPEEARARRAVASAVRAGILQRQPCETCGLLDVQAHHDDYTKPLEKQPVNPRSFSPGI